MHLLSCEHPLRVYNKYSQEYVWVPCGKCNICKNRRAAHYTELLERERSQHLFTFFVTLTYADEFLPMLSIGDFVSNMRGLRNYSFVSNRERDSICIPFSQLFPMEKYKDDFHFSDLRYFYSEIENGGLPIVSKTDAQLFLKRLNKYIHDNVTHQFKNFRYFLVSEYGSTTFRPHFHAIFFVDNPKLGDRFADCVSACWHYGINDTQYVENSACAYVSQYINKHDDLPYVLRVGKLSSFFLCSRNPFIGTFSKCAEDDAEIVNLATPITYGKRKSSDVQFSDVPLEQSYQNRLFPKCPCFGSLSDSMRVELYTVTCRILGKNLKEFLNNIYDYLTKDYLKTEFYLWLSSKVNFSDSRCLVFQFDHRNPWVLFDEYSYNFLRRLYYCSRKVARQACQFGLSIYDYIQKIFDYYNNKEIYLLKKFYEFQEQVSETDCDSLVLMYPEFLWSNGIYNLKEFVEEICSSIALNELADAANYAYNNKKCHFKNAYLDSLALKKKSIRLFNLIKTYLYGKKCNETIEAFAA